ncbi:hypothetical protein Tco_1577486 [Tanacetum coccineum]
MRRREEAWGAETCVRYAASFENIQDYASRQMLREGRRQYECLAELSCDVGTVMAPGGSWWPKPIEDLQELLGPIQTSRNDLICNVRKR